MRNINDFIKKWEALGDPSIGELIDFIIEINDSLILAGCISREFLFGHSSGIIYALRVMKIISGEDVCFVSKKIYEYIDMQN